MNGRIERTDVMYFRPDQIDDTKEEIKRLEDILNAPPHIVAQISSRKDMQRTRKNLGSALDRHSPKPYKGEENDVAAVRATALEEAMKAGMPTHQEMRAGGVGMADKLLSWERKNKKNAIEWKNIRMRQHVTECEGGPLERVRDIANVDRFRPWGKSQATDAQIIPADYYLPPGMISQTVVFSDNDIAAVTEISPKIAAMLSTLSNDERAKIKEALMADTPETDAPRRRGRPPLDGKQTKESGHGISVSFSG